MATSKQPVRRISKKEVDELFGIEEWTRHHVMMEDPTDGQPSNGVQFRCEAELRGVKRAFEIINRKVLVVELGNEVEYTTSITNLHKAKERRKEKSGANYISDYLKSIRKIK